REGLHELDGALAGDVEATTEEAAGKTPQGTGCRAEKDGEEGDGEGGAASPDDAAQRVAPDLVGAEIVLRGRRLRHNPEIRFERVVRRQLGSGDGHAVVGVRNEPPDVRRQRA